ncbi:bifunctional [glutamine synthetase] adenylyltransferase/[glutamine synthetase]-adenylyl-L-tyrosine phosphorylase [Govanella unica]|uniref:Bifunctional glutamine synthetase adenylyltransferase/adenylyl-removing enzyme n=1 Tax=Govanella unica TaxID=2975056 RepID=A0A9X3Z728_9PROT|nr:bifunctional [glutamine synthetase] adenylyltransferase/[glutamine synthetase]-adenylyl-L-tyrosine phosphorylase [Govania unica]MDA5193549.1 bifunctional [glutamine synthetase] adenylyltransferase/[glutamine synthetase]-adenylyl-L-tyrosine phosphorylase [Govania unica]
MPITHSPPLPFNAAALKNGWEDLKSAAQDAGLHDAGLDARLGPIDSAILDAIFGNSPFLSRLAIRDVGFTLDLLTRGSRALVDELGRDLRTDVPNLTTTDQVMAALRRAKNRMALAIAVADIADLWTVEEITAALSDFAECALDLATAHLLKLAMLRGEIAPPKGVTDIASHPATPDIAAGSGYFLLGMGKLGARELNYSSDIDLIVFFDEEIVPYIGKRTAQDCYIKVTRELVRMMQELTSDGYVFRTDLKLRPDPGATPVAISVGAAEVYYQSVGLNWERAAMIKARPVAGDRAAASGFLSLIRGFVWRRHLDFAAVEDIHAIKGMIHRHHRHGDIALKGHDVKLGRGGIREVEFFCQIQQLISGGRERRLQAPRTLEALQMLRDLNKITPETEHELAAAYRFFRRVEHRLQMIRDEQTHMVPATDEGVAHIATFLGYDSVRDLETEMLDHLRTVKRHYDQLLEPDRGDNGDTLPAPSLSSIDDSSSMESQLGKFGFSDVTRIAQILAGWEFGRYRALRTPRSREILKRILPRLLMTLGESTDPDAAVTKFDEFLAKLPSGVQLLSLFQANPWLLDLMTEILGVAPALAAELAHRPLLLDAVLSPAFFNPLPDHPTLDAGLRDILYAAKDYQDILDLSRVWVNEQRFHVGVQILRGAIEAEAAGAALTRIADVLLNVMLGAVEDQFAQRYGRLPGGRLVVIGMGKLGGAELSFTSDLDMIFIYDAPEDAASDGAKSLTAPVFYTRLTQAYINALTAMTGEGRLYEVDMRLRPSGSSGPLAVSLDAFRAYQQASAWTWEHMALTRARLVAGDTNLAEATETVIRDVLTAPRDADKLLLDVADMRRRLRNEFGTSNIWSIKHCPGGIVDVEFIWQYLQLKHASAHPEIVTEQSGEAISRLAAAGLIPAPWDHDLRPAYDLLHEVQGMLRLCTGKDFTEDDAPTGLKSALAKASGDIDFAALKDRLIHSQTSVTAAYNALIETPAAALSKGQIP